MKYRNESATQIVEWTMRQRKEKWIILNDNIICFKHRIQ